MAPDQESSIEIPVSLAKRLIADVGALELLLHTQKPEDEVIIPRQGTWTRSQLRRLKAEVSVYPAALTLLELAAAQAGAEVTYDDLVSATGMERNQVRAELGALTRLSTRLFGERKWPLRVRQAKDGSMNYMMPVEIADWWNEES